MGRLKRISLCLFFLFTAIFSFSQRTLDDVKSLKMKFSSELIKYYDRFDGIFWVKTRPVKLGSDPTYLEISLNFGIFDNNKTTYLMIKHEYKSSDWLFVKCFKYLLGKAKEEQKRCSICDNSVERIVHGSNRISEISSTVVSKEIKEFLLDFVNTRKTFVVKVEGENFFELFSWSPIFGSKFPDHVGIIIQEYEKLGGSYP